MASGFSPGTNTTASITPFNDSKTNTQATVTSTPYTPVITSAATAPYHYPSEESSPSLSGDAAQVAANTDSVWLSPDMWDTPSSGGGVELFASQIDYRAALACGGANNAACGQIVTTIGANDPRFNEVYHTMFSFPQKTLEKENYPFTNR